MIQIITSRNPRVNIAYAFLCKSLNIYHLYRREENKIGKIKFFLRIKILSKI